MVPGIRDGLTGRDRAAGGLGRGRDAGPGDGMDVSDYGPALRGMEASLCQGTAVLDRGGDVKGSGACVGGREGDSLVNGRRCELAGDRLQSDCVANVERLAKTPFAVRITGEHLDGNPVRGNQDVLA